MHKRIQGDVIKLIHNWLSVRRQRVMTDNDVRVRWIAKLMLNYPLGSGGLARVNGLWG